MIDLLPIEAPTRVEAIVAAMDRLGLKQAIYFGDAVADKEVFQLRWPDVFGIHVGKDDQTPAPYFMNKQSEMLGLLNSLVGVLERQHNDAKNKPIAKESAEAGLVVLA